ncbi:MAG: bifunctional UDP-N-acetylglucosamine diphosphorylase/glucosamine-1-phosphate N-acetyltransferase GlmU [Gammaproteobacteria bacterium]|nr:bifunctional UDP-N-acetylglucosamine diphosphorylase/glucosamine-1-phosphate N-acetyltransferase GlmU [Gammaproteobacteria bacterium]
MKQQAKTLEVVVLAAGQGKRMASNHPKVLHPLAGRPLLRHVLDTVAALQPSRVHVVVGHGAESVRAAVADDVTWVMQAERLGTGHAVSQALPGIADDSLVLVVYGDVPLIGAATLQACADAAAGEAVALVTAELEEPAQLGRILRDADGGICGIVEYRDADAGQRDIREINSGIMAAQRSILAPLLAKLSPDNAQGEYYLTDVVGLAVEQGIPVQGLTVADPEEVAGINDRAELAAMERRCQRRHVAALMAAGVSVADPERVDVRGRVSAGRDCFIDVNVVLEGDVRLGDDVYLGPGVVLRDSSLGDGVRVEAHTVVEGARVAAGCILGPFARLRPGTELAEDVKIGNFVETKKTLMGRGSKANHLAYLGDATVGEDCNVGAGAVTCNYDGIDKHPTVIGDNVFVGTNTTLVAPLEIETGAYVAAGSTVTSKVNAGELAVGRGRQRNIQGWRRPDQRKERS